MDYSLLKFFHIVGAVLIGGGLIGVWMADLRSRQLRELKPFSEAVRNIAVFYDGLVVPGALLLLISGNDGSCPLRTFTMIMANGASRVDS